MRLSVAQWQTDPWLLRRALDCTNSAAVSPNFCTIDASNSSSTLTVQAFTIYGGVNITASKTQASHAVSSPISAHLKEIISQCGCGRKLHSPYPVNTIKSKKNK